MLIDEITMHTIHVTLEKIRAGIYTKIGELDVECFKSKEPLPYGKRTEGEHLKLSRGDKWGDLFDCAWFHFYGAVPETAKGKRVVLQLDVSGEGLIVDENGDPVRAITVVEQPFDSRIGLAGKRVVDFCDCALGGETVDFWMDAGCNCLFGSLRNDGTLVQADICLIDEKRRELFYDMQVLINLLTCLDEKQARYRSVYKALCECKSILVNFTPEEIERADALLKTELNKKGGTPTLTLNAIGHSHLDLAWLWPIRETIRKGARTFSTVLTLMDKYPDFKFGASQPQLYAWIKEYYPALYERVREKIKEGRWEVQGCMWVEADMNLIGGESMVRQIIYGKGFFKKEFGIDVKHLWMPDVFGYSAALPQILKKSGCKYFMTQKLSWNLYNKFPYYSFIWQGIDSSEVLAHMLPEETYNSPLAPESVYKAEKNYNEAGDCDEALVLYGIGDGGGGPGPEHLERAKRLTNLAGLCPVKQGFAEPFFERLEKNRGKLNRWCGELYFERHQGTFTTQARNKKYNRQAEILLRELEFALILSGEKYPAEELEKIWKEVLLYQFHDIIPGSSIKRVYDESCARYEILLKRINELIENCYSNLSNGLTAFNSLSWEREVLIENDGKYYIEKIPSMGFCNVKNRIGSFKVKAGKGSIENQFIKVKFNKNGSICEIIDKTAERQILSQNSNVYSVYQETNADCWDIDVDYANKKIGEFKLVSQEFFVRKAYAICEQEYEYNASKLKVTLSLAHNAKRVEVFVDADWHENCSMLRTAVNTNIVTDHATFEIQYGKISRANNNNTTWQKAQFEVSAHKWVDLSEADYGVSLLNDCKYGYKVKGSTIDINLLRSQNYPGVDADRGTHTFKYAIYLHNGNDYTGNVVKEAYDFNYPVRLVQGHGNIKNEFGSIFSISEGAVIETVKKAEDGNDIILRIYEPNGASVKVKLQTNRVFSNAYECDLLENIISELHINDSVDFNLKPFEIFTLRLKK